MTTAVLASAAPPFFTEVVALFVVGAALAYVCHRLHVTPIVSFLVTGALLGPHAFGIVRNEALIESAAELGVVLLLFTIGIEFSLDKLARIKRLILVGGGAQVTLVIAVVTGVLALFDVPWRAGVFTGCLVALSSTAIVMKLLMGTGEMASREGQAALGILIFQDLAVVAMVLLIPLLGGRGGSAGDVAAALGKAVGIVVLVLVAARRIMPPLLEAVARTCSQEIFLLSVVGICFGTAYLTSLAGVSLSLGAFLAGLMVSESRYSQVAFGEVLPLQILFSAVFFVSVGLLLDVGFLIGHPTIIIAAVVGVLALKVVTTGTSLLMLGYGIGPAACTAMLLAQVGEFSFVLERTGREMGLHPAGLDAGGGETFIGATVALMIATPFLFRLGDRLRSLGSRRAAEPLPAVVQGDLAQSGQYSGLRDHVLIAGLGEVGRTLAGLLKERRIPYVVVTLSPDAALEAERGALVVVRGNYTRQHELKVAGLHAARLLVVADDDHETTTRVLAAARALHPTLPLFARARSTTEAATLRASGADQVAVDDAEGLLRLVTLVLQATDVPGDEIRDAEAAFRSSPRGHPPPPADERLATASSAPPDVDGAIGLSDEQRRTSACAHAAGTNRVVPSGAGCVDCLQSGDSWVHLRICMTCGRVGCCDSSPNRHATKHAQTSGHPIIRSLEPGEEWAWCYEDREFL